MKHDSRQCVHIVEIFQLIPANDFSGSAANRAACPAAARAGIFTSGNPAASRGSLGARNRGKIPLIEDVTMMKLMAGNEVSQGKNRDRVVAGDAAPQPRFRVQRTK